MMRRYLFIIATLLPLLGSTSLTFSHDEDSLKEKLEKFTDEDIREGMNILIGGVSQPLKRNKFFDSPDEISELIDELLDEASGDTEAATALSEVFYHLQRAKRINSDNFPAPLIHDIQRTLKTNYRHNQSYLYYFMTKEPKRFASDGMNSAWIGLATGDILVCGNFLVALKILRLPLSKTTFRQDFEGRFPNYKTLYAISPVLKAYVQGVSQIIERLRKNNTPAKTYQYNDLYRKIQEGNVEEVIDRVYKNFLKGDMYASSYLAKALAGMGANDVFEKLDDTLIRNKASQMPDKYMNTIENFFKDHAALYGHNHCHEPTAVTLAQKIKNPPKITLPIKQASPPHKKPVSNVPKKTQAVPAKQPVKKGPTPVKPAAVPSKAPSKPVPAKAVVQPVKQPETKKPEEKMPPAIPGYTLKKYVDGKWWYFRGNGPVKRAPQ